MSNSGGGSRGSGTKFRSPATKGHLSSEGGIRSGWLGYALLARRELCPGALGSWASQGWGAFLSNKITIKSNTALQPQTFKSRSTTSWLVFNLVMTYLSVLSLSLCSKVLPKERFFFPPPSCKGQSDSELDPVLAAR